MTITQALIFAKSKLRPISNPLLEAELLLSFVLKKEREFLLIHPETKISKRQFSEFEKVIKLRLKNVPFAYICGYKYFYGLKFIVNKNVLVPRPETEMMVELACNMQHAARNTQHSTRNTYHATRNKNGENLLFVDIGTGSGCIAIAVAKELADRNIIFCSYAIDVSAAALSIAKKNAKLNGVDKLIKFRQGNLLEPVLKNLSKSKIIHHKSKILITANLPYLTPTQIKNSPSIKKEPRLALVAGNDGLKYYRELFKQIKANAHRLPPTTLLLEIDHTQKAGITKLIKQILPQAKFEIKKDLGGRSRLVNIKC